MPLLGIAIASLLATNASAAAITAPTSEWLDIDADAPVVARIRGHERELTLTAGFWPNIILNAAAAAPLGLSGATPDAWLNFARRRVLRLGGTNTGVVINGLTGFRDVLWVPAFDGNPRQGVVDLQALPAPRIRVRLGGATPHGDVLSLPLLGDRNKSTQAIARTEDGQSFDLLAQFHRHARLPRASARLAADLAVTHQGQLQGPAWQEDMGFGQYRLVRHLALARPLILGPLRFDGFAVDITPVSDGATRLALNQKPLPDADADASEALVRGRAATISFAGRWLILSRSQLDEQRCSQLTVDKRRREWALTCMGNVRDAG